MRHRIPFLLFALAVTVIAQTPAAAPIPHLEKRGLATQLIVDGKPWLALAGEVDNSASSSLEYMDTAWPKIVKANLNTVLVGIGWDWVEPEEGKYDFTLVDGLLDGARKHNLRLIFLWFGSWKNGLSSFGSRAPASRAASRWKCSPRWVKPAWHPTPAPTRPSCGI
jgi:GH35 family endo-1,4-beta-xylanase